MSLRISTKYESELARSEPVFNLEMQPFEVLLENLVRRITLVSANFPALKRQAVVLRAVL